MVGSYDVYYGESVCGKLNVGKRGAVLEFSCDCEIVSDGVLRLYCKSGGEFKTLGVCVPEGGRLRLKKCLSKCALAAIGIDSIDACRVSEDEPKIIRTQTWRPLDDPSEILSGDDTPKIPGALVSERDGVTLLAVPLGEEEFPLMPVFRFGTPEEIEGEPYLVFGIKNGEIFK